MSGPGISPVPVPPPLPPPSAAGSKPRSYLHWFGWIGIGIATTIAAGGIFWLGGPPWGRPEETAGLAKVGDAVFLRLPAAEPNDLRGVWLARTDSSWNEMHDARRLRDAGRLDRLEATGLSFGTANGTRGVVMGANLSGLRVRLLDGPRGGRRVGRSGSCRGPRALPMKPVPPPSGTAENPPGNEGVSRRWTTPVHRRCGRAKTKPAHVPNSVVAWASSPCPCATPQTRYLSHRADGEAGRPWQP